MCGTTGSKGFTLRIPTQGIRRILGEREATLVILTVSSRLARSRTDLEGSDLTVRFHTSEFTPHMLARLANDHFIMPASYLLENDPTTVARHPIGTGAYVFDEWVAGEQITMSANP